MTVVWIGILLSVAAMAVIVLTRWQDRVQQSIQKAVKEAVRERVQEIMDESAET